MENTKSLTAPKEAGQCVSVFKYADDQKEKSLFKFSKNNNQVRYVQIIPINKVFARVCGANSNGEEIDLEAGYELKGDQAGPVRIIHCHFSKLLKCFASSANVNKKRRFSMESPQRN